MAKRISPIEQTMSKRIRLMEPPPSGAGAANLPDEIVNEILQLLPARSVLRARAVCRRWAASLSSPGFLAAYAAKAKARRMTKLVFLAPSTALSSSNNSSTAVYCCALGQGAATAAVDPLFTMDDCVRTGSLRLSSRTCSGLVLFSDTDSEAYWVCNPSTGERRRLPQQRRGLMYSSAGLVQDGRSKECKVVHLFLKEDVRIGCELYTLGDPSSQWRLATGAVQRLGVRTIKLTKALQAESTVTRVPPVSAHGCLHWLLYPSKYSTSPQLGRDAILCFSGEDETFGFISAPAGVHIEDYIRLDEHLPAVPIRLAEINGSLCMVHDLRDRESCLHVWALRDRSAGEWSLDYRVALMPLLATDAHCPRIITVLGARGGSDDDTSSQQLLIATSEHKVHAYDPVAGGVETVFSVEETDIGFQKEAAAALGLALYEDNLTSRLRSESPRDKKVISAVTEILVRLPVKSIARCMLVCKRWCSLIQSNAFTSQMVMKRRSRISMVTNDTDMFFGFAPLETWLQASGPAALMDTLVGGKIICSKPCHGLNLISTSSDDYLCNPCTGAVMCLGIRGKPHVVISPGSDISMSRGNAFTVGRNVGLGFDQATGELVAVEISYLRGALVCIAKASRADAWSYVGKPPRPVTDMPPAHVAGTLYWMGKQTPHHQERVVVALDISTRAFRVLPCEPCRRSHHHDDDDAFLVELNGTLSLVVANAETEEMEVWKMHSPAAGSWSNAHKMCLRGHPDFSLKTEVVVPIEVDAEDGRILLNTGRALGYYDVRTGALSTLYSLNQLQLPRCYLAFPMLLQESLARIPDDELSSDEAATSQVTSRRTDHPGPGNKGAVTPRFIFHRCQRTGCQGNADIYSGCCRRQVCRECIRQCLDEHPYYGLHTPLPASYTDVIAGIQSNGLPMEHPSVPGPEFCYYYSTIDGDVARHVYVSLKDLVRNKQPRHLIECVYRMDGHGVRETWSSRYIEDDEGRPPLDYH